MTGTKLDASTVGFTGRKFCARFVAGVGVFTLAVLLTAVLVTAAPAQAGGDSVPSSSLSLSGPLPFLSSPSSESLEVYPGPPGVAPSPQYTVQVTQGSLSYSSFVYQNQNPAYLTNGQPSGISTSSSLERSTAWTSFSFSGAPVTVQITNSKTFTAARILPSHWKIVPTISGNVVRFTVTQRGQLAVDFCYSADQCPNDLEWDITNPMLVFSNPGQGHPTGNYLTATPGTFEAPGSAPPLSVSESMVYFPPGVYLLQSPYNLGVASDGTGQGAFLAAGAYVIGTFAIAAGATGNTIGGFGILSGESIPQSVCDVAPAGCPDMIYGMTVAGNISIEGLTIINAPWSAIQLNGVGDTVRNVKIISWQGNETGILAGAELDTGSVIESSFMKLGDDALALISSNLRVTGCTIWQLDNASPFEWGVNQPSNINHITVEDTDVIRTEYSWPNPSNAVFSAVSSGAKSQKSDFTFNNIHVENSTFQLFKIAVGPNHYTSPTNDTLGSISNLSFNNIEVSDAQELPDLFESFDLEHQVSNVVFRNVTVAGEKLPSPRISFNANRTYSLDGTVFSGLLWRSQSEPQEFQMSVFSGSLTANTPATISISQPKLTASCQTQAIADFYGDGYASVLFLDTVTQKLTLWQDPYLTYAVPFSCTDFPFYTLKPADGQVAGVGDFNGDGYADILLWNSSTQAGKIVLMNGSQVLKQIPVQPATSSDWSVAGVADFNRTGYSDILLRDTNGNLEILYFGSSGYTTSLDFTPTDLGYVSTAYYDTQWPKTSGHFDASWTVIGVRNFDYTVYPGVVLYSASTGEIGLLTFLGVENAFPNFSRPPIGTVFAQIPSGSEVQAVGDFNGDSAQDLFLRNLGNGESSIWYMGYFGGDLYQPEPAPTFSPDWQIQGQL